MLMDTQLQFSALQSLINAAGDLASTNIVDTGAAQDEGIGEPAFIEVRIGTAVLAAAGACSVQPVLQTDVDATFANAMVEFPLGPAIAKASLTANTVIYRGRLPVGLKRFMRLVYRISTNPVTAGTADAFIVENLDAQQLLAKNFTVS